MAIVFDAPVSPDALTAFTRNVPPQPQFTLDQILPVRFFNDNKVPWNNTGVRKNRTARYRSYDGRLHVSSRQTVGGGTVSLPPLSTSYSKGEYEALQLAFLQTGGSRNSELIRSIYDDGQNGTLEVLARLEQARGDVLLDGKFTLAGEGDVYLEADFGVPAENFNTAAMLWSNPAAPIVGDLRAWVDEYIALNGVAPGAMHMSRKILNYILLNTEVRNYSGTLAGVPALVTQSVAEATLGAYGLPPIGQIYDATVDIDGTTTRVYPENRVLFTPPNPSDLGFTAMGISATALELVRSRKVELSFEQAAGIVGVVIKEGPPFREFVFIDAVGMPVLANPNMLMVNTVIA